MISVSQLKIINQDGDYYFCKICLTWHRFRFEVTSLGYKHVSNINENETNSLTAKYYFCGSCNTWHTNTRKDHLQYRMHIQRDPNMITATEVQQTHTLAPS